MADDEEQVESGEQALEPERDTLIQLLAIFCDKGLEAPVTLHVNGLVISGFMIGRKKFFEQWSAAFTTGWEEQDASGFKQALGLDDIGEDEDEDPADRHFIHLQEARVFTPGHQPQPANGMLWRGKIADVNGFSYGILSIETG